MYRKLFILLLIFMFLLLKPGRNENKNLFFDIKGFFESEVKRLTNKKSTVNKSVRQNEQSEKRLSQK
jgi:hypothetical protein